MTVYSAPLDDMNFLLYRVFQVDKRWPQLTKLSDMAERETCDAILQEAAKVCEGLIAPLNRSGDEEGCHWHENGDVATPKGFKEAYRTYVAGGWTGLSGNPVYGGMGLPKTLSVLCEEMLYSASNAFALYPALTVGACIAIEAHASEPLKQQFLPKLYSGEWSAAMALTESQAGTDLGIIRTQAEDLGDGTFQLRGSKIFITAGEHDLSDNIIHLVLARLPAAPPGAKGISLFLAPKFWLDDAGQPAHRNSINCGSIEHKMGIKASATCVMNYDDARAYLIGEPHQGLKYMFTMMNYERLSIGIQGTGSAAMSYQNARSYALERLQGRAAAGAVAIDKMADPIIVHPDVRRMLLTMRAWTEGARALAVYTAEQLDIVKYSEDAAEIECANRRVALLTPVCKAFFTDKGFDSCVLGQQVFGGHGYICEYGQEQLVRDTRIAQIYEGTNGIQALDFTARKVVGSGGALIDEFVVEIRTWISEQTDETMAYYVESLEAELARLHSVTEDLIQRANRDPDAAGAASVEYLHLFAHVTYAWLWARMAAVTIACDDGECDNDEYQQSDFSTSKQATAEFFYRHLLPSTKALALSIAQGSCALMSLDAELF